MARQLNFVFAITAMCVGACGDDGDAAADAGADDGGADAGVAPGACGASVAAPLVGTDIEGIPVLFHDADGVLVFEGVTDGAGQVSYDQCRPNTAITALFSDAGMPRFDVATIGGISPGHTVVFGVPQSMVAAPSGTISVAFDNVPVGTTGFEFRAGGICQGNGPAPDPLSTMVDTSCLGSDPSTLDVLGRVWASGELVGLGFATDVTRVEGGTTEVTVDSWQAPTELDVTVSNLPATITGATVTTVQARDGLVFAADFVPEPLTISDGAASGSRIALPSSFVDHVNYRIRLQDANGGYYGFVGAVEPGSPITADLARAPAAIGGHLVRLSDPARPEVNVVLNGELAGDELLEFRLSWTGGLWSLLMPASLAEGGFAFPNIPDSLASYGPSALTPPTSARVHLVRLSGLDFATIIGSGRLAGQPLTAANERLESGERILYSGYFGGL